MNNALPRLAKGDLILIVAPAKAIEAEHVRFAKEFFEQQGYRVDVGSHCLGQYNYFSGTAAERLRDFQWALDHPEAKVIVCARGGYGCIQLVDRINWAGQITEPKWIVGFSDVTVFHQHLQRNGIQSLHGTMPLNFSENSALALETLMAALQGNAYNIAWETSSFSRKGKVTGTLLGGNLSIVYSLLGTDEVPDYHGSVLFLEDLSEPLYSIDRMFYALGKAGVLDAISGLVIGGMTELKDTAHPFGASFEEIILSHFTYRQIPIAFGCPAGHISDNRALIFGAEVTLEVGNQESTLYFRELKV